MGGYQPYGQPYGGIYGGYGVPYGGVPYGYGFGYAPIGGIYGGGVYGGFGGGYVDGSFYQQNPYGPWGVPSLGPFDPYIMGGYGMYGMGYPGGEPPVYPDYGLGTGLPFFRPIPVPTNCTVRLRLWSTIRLWSIWIWFWWLWIWFRWYCPIWRHLWWCTLLWTLKRGLTTLWQRRTCGTPRRSQVQLQMGSVSIVMLSHESSVSN